MLRVNNSLSGYILLLLLILRTHCYESLSTLDRTIVISHWQNYNRTCKHTCIVSIYVITCSTLPSLVTSFLCLASSSTSISDQPEYSVFIYFVLLFYVQNGVDIILQSCNIPMRKYLNGKNLYSQVKYI